MSANFQIECKKQNGNLHISPKGDFDGSSAWQLIRLLGDAYDGDGQVFIETRNLGKVYPFGCRIFQSELNRCRIPANRLFFTGNKGSAIAPQGSVVDELAPKPPCRCPGNCAICRCAKQQKEEMTG